MRSEQFSVWLAGGARQDTTSNLSGVATVPQFKKRFEAILTDVTRVAFFQPRPCLGKLRTMCPNDNRSFVVFSDELNSAVI